MDTPFGWRMRMLRMNPLASCLAMALAVGTGQVTASPTLQDAINKTAPASRANLITTPAESLVDPSLQEAMLKRMLATMSRTPPPVPAGALAVTNCNDSGAGSFRDAMNNAVDGDTIDLTNLDCSQITLTTGSVIALVDNLTIQGPGALALDINGNDQYAPILHVGSGTLSINDVMISHGFKYFTDAQTNPAKGGCIYSTNSISLSNSWVKYCQATSSNTTLGVKGGGIYARSSLAVIDSSITSNRAYSAHEYAYGGGIYSQGSLTIINSTVSGNTAAAPESWGQGAGAEVGSIFHTAGGAFVAKYSQISGNTATGGNGGLGGGLYTTGNVIIQNSTISANQADIGAGLDLIEGANTDYPWTIANSTISGNHANVATGGILNGGYPMRIGNSTIAFNTDVNTNQKYGAGLRIGSSTNVELQSTIIAGNTTDLGSGPVEDDVYGEDTSTLSGANNMIGLSLVTPPGDTVSGDPLLQPLHFNGGDTPTHALLPESPAVSAGNNTAGVSFDQRGPGFPRQIGLNVDIGAFELDTDDVIFADNFDG